MPVVLVLNEELKIIDEFSVELFDEFIAEAQKRIDSGAVSVGFCFKVQGGDFWRVVDHLGKRIIEKDRVMLSDDLPEGETEGTDWFYPSQLLSTSQADFDFPEYPGLSIAMRLYIFVGKISWWLALLILVGFNIFYAVFTVGLGLLLTLPVSFLILLLMNLGLAFQFGSCEIVKVLIRIENNTRKETVKDGDE